MADQAFRQRCSELWSLCERACTGTGGSADPVVPTASARATYGRMASERCKDTMSAAHGFARACLADGTEQRHGPRETLAASTSATLALADTWDRESGGWGSHDADDADDSAARRVHCARQVAESAAQMLALDGQAVMPAYNAFLETAAEAGEVLSSVEDTQDAVAAAESDCARGSETDTIDRGSCHPDLYRRQLELVSGMASLSLSLQNVPLPERSDRLHSALELINRELEGPAQTVASWLKSATAGTKADGDQPPSPQPVLFPLEAVGKHSRRVLRIVPHTARVLKSRERTPLMLNMEVLADGGRAAAGRTNTAAVAGNADDPKCLSPATAQGTQPVLEPAPEPADAKARADAGADGETQKHRCYGVQFRPPSPESGSPRVRPERRAEPEPEPEPEPKLLFESATDVENKLREVSPYGHLPAWGIATLIIKSGDDIRQEQLAMRLIAEFDQIFSAADLALWLRPYRVMATDPNSGMIEMLPSVMSIHALKDRCPPSPPLLPATCR